jgi:hypothetical protein
MNEFEVNNEMELVLQAKRNQPELFAQLPATTKIAVGIYASTKPSTNGLSADDRLRLAGFKQRIAQDNLSPTERTSLALKISELEAK